MRYNFNTQTVRDESTSRRYIYAATELTFLQGAGMLVSNVVVFWESILSYAFRNKRCDFGMNYL